MQRRKAKPSGRGRALIDSSSLRFLVAPLAHPTLVVFLLDPTNRTRPPRNRNFFWIPGIQLFIYSVPFPNGPTRKCIDINLHLALRGTLQRLHTMQSRDHKGSVYDLVREFGYAPENRWQRGPWGIRSRWHGAQRVQGWWFHDTCAGFHTSPRSRARSHERGARGARWLMHPARLPRD